MIVVDQLVKRLRLRSKIVLIHAVFRELPTLIPSLVFQHFFRAGAGVVNLIYSYDRRFFCIRYMCFFQKPPSCCWQVTQHRIYQELFCDWHSPYSWPPTALQVGFFALQVYDLGQCADHAHIFIFKDHRYI